jgi:DNA ligase-1
MKFQDLVSTSAAVRGTGSRLEKTALLAGLLTRVDSDEVPIAIGFLIGWPRQGRFGIGWATVSAARPEVPALAAELSLREIDEKLGALKAATGPRSAAERRRLLSELLARATREEQDFLLALLTGEVRQGALEGVMQEAVASAANLPADQVRRAVMLAGDLGTVAVAVLTQGEAGLSQYRLQLFRPVEPMLAESAASVAEAMAALGDAVLEWKLDGARIQVHRKDDRVAVYTRSLNDVTLAVPEVVEAVLQLPNRELILDGEVIALAPDGRPLPFQETMRRFGRRLDVETLRAELPLSPFFFDLLRFDGTDLIDLPLLTRLERLDAVVNGALRVRRMVVGVTEDGEKADADDAEKAELAEKFYGEALQRGHEGIMAKAPGAPYAAGRRGAAWLKIKTAHTLDLVVLAAEWGSGRRKGWLSNLHLGARDPSTGGFVMLGKTFKGMTDAVLAWQTTELLARETGREGHIVWVRPELVVEVAFNEVQRSSQYPGGVTLRFARIKGYRLDKRPDEADTIETVRGFLTTSEPAPAPEP